MAAFLMNFSELLWNGAENAAIALKNCSGKSLAYRTLCALRAKLVCTHQYCGDAGSLTRT